MSPIKAIILLLCCIAAQTVASAQQAKYHPSDTVIAHLRGIDRKINAAKEGMILPEFSGVSTEGRQVTNASLKGKVSLLIFWDPWCNCFEPAALGGLPELAKQHKDFQILSMMSDTGRLAWFRSTHTLVTPVVILPSRASMHELNAGNGFPSCVLVNRDGTIVKISFNLHTDFFDEQAFADKIRQLLMF